MDTPEYAVFCNLQYLITSAISDLRLLRIDRKLQFINSNMLSAKVFDSLIVYVFLYIFVIYINMESMCFQVILLSILCLYAIVTASFTLW